MEVEAFLTHLAVNRRVAAPTQNQALNALVFLYREVLKQPFEGVDVMRAQESKRLPVVLSVEKLQETERTKFFLVSGQFTDRP